MEKWRDISRRAPRGWSSVQITGPLLLLLIFLAGCSTGSGFVGTWPAGTATPSSATIYTKDVQVPPLPTLALPSPSPTGTPATHATPSPPGTSPAPGSGPGPAPAPGTALPPGSTLPTEAECAARVTAASAEIRPENTQANHTVPTATQIAGLATWGPADGMDARSDSLRKQITGNFTGTTDQILQWVACKWGIDPNIVRAEAVIESHWRQNTQGDYTTNQSNCPPGTWNGQGCYQSYGILQVKYIYSPTTWPMIRNDTAFSAEYTYGQIRACYEGWVTYLASRTPLPGYARYHAGDIWGCIGRWYSGSWYDQGAVDYINKVKEAFATKPWLQANF